MPSIPTKIWLALKARAEEAAAAVSLPVSWPNQDFASPPKEYLRVRHVPNSPLRLFHAGDAPHERLGVLQIMLMAEPNERSSIATEVAGRIAEFFPPDLPMRYDGVTVKVRLAPRVGEVVPQGAYAEVAVEVQYRCFA